MLNFLQNYRAQRNNRKGQKLLAQGKFKQAAQCFAQSLLLQPLPEVFFNLAVAHIALAQWQKALDLLTTLQQNPNYAKHRWVLLTIADVNMMLRQWDKAETCLRHLVKMYPEPAYKKQLERASDVVLRENYVLSKENFYQAQQLIEKKDYQQAMKLMTKAQELDPQNAVIANDLGSLIIMAEADWNKALTQFARALELDPDNQKYAANVALVTSKIKK